MASNRYISNPNQNRYSTPPTYRYNPHPYLDPGFAEEEDSRAFVDDRNLGRRPGHVLGLPSDRRAETGRSHPDDRYLIYDSTRPWSPAASYETPTMLWPRLNQNARPRSPAATDRNYSFTRRASLETRSPISTPINYRGVDRGLPSTSTSHVNAQTPHQPRTGVSRTGPTRTRRFQPYETSRSHFDEYSSAGERTPTPEPSQTPYQSPQITTPSGGTSEATADAEQNHQVTEENVAPRRRARMPRGKGAPRPGRTEHQGKSSKLCFWAKEWRGERCLPSTEAALTAALKVIESRREPVYDKPHLLKGRVKRTGAGNKESDTECDRRKRVRKLNEQLSRYYKLEDDDNTWMTRELLEKVLAEVKRLPIPPAEPQEQGSTAANGSDSEEVEDTRS